MRASAILLLVIFVVPAPATALPEYAAREARACAHCHLDPGGGGPRNARGQYFERHDHSFEGFDEAAEAAEAQTTEGGAAGPLQTLLETLSFSGNLRMCYSLSQGPHPGATRGCNSCHVAGERAPDRTFFLMQGELAVSARMSNAVSFVYSNDLGITRDVYAVLRLGEGGAFVKTGAFEVPYGAEEIKDHNSLVKVRHNVGSNLRDVGVQIAVQRPRHFASVAVMNGGFRDPEGVPIRISGLTPDGTPAVAAHAGVLAPRLRVGGSVMFQDATVIRPREIFGGLFGAFFGDRWSVSAEVDIGGAKRSGTDSTNFGFVAQAEVEPVDRLSLGVKVDRWDPDTDAPDDGETWFTAIIEHEVSRNASIEARYRVRDEEGSQEVANDDFLTMLNVHF